MEIIGQLCKRQESFEIPGNMRTVLKLWGRFKSEPRKIRTVWKRSEKFWGHLEISRQFGNCLENIDYLEISRQI